MRRLVSFLGIGNYKPTTYQSEDKVFSLNTRFIAHALVKMLEVDELHLIATSAAWETNGKKFLDGLPEKVNFTRSEIPDGQSKDELWEQFEVLRKVITEGKPDTVILDITLGFRAQPFFSAGVLAQLNASGQLPADTQVYYGDFRRNEDYSPIWDLTLFVELLGWAQGSALMRQTGNGRLLVETLKREKDQRSKNIAQSGGGTYPHTGPLISAIRDFSNDLTTTRIASLITGYAQESSKRGSSKSSAQKLLDALDKYREEVKQWLPALVPLLDTLGELAEGIPAPSLQGKEGLKAMQQLATRYLELERYSEAATVLREGWISAYGDARGVEVNSDDFSNDRRAETEGYWRNSLDTPDLSIAEIRNDIQHGGFNEQPLDSSVLKERVAELISKFSEIEPVPLQNQVAGKIWFVSRHPGAIEWSKRQGIQVDHLEAHLDMEKLQPGDLVIGTLPIHLVYQLNKKNCTYQHLSLDIPADLRGKEMDADMLGQCNARLEGFSVVRELP